MAESLPAHPPSHSAISAKVDSADPRLPDHVKHFVRYQTLPLALKCRTSLPAPLDSFSMKLTGVCRRRGIGHETPLLYSCLALMPWLEQECPPTWAVFTLVSFCPHLPCLWQEGSCRNAWGDSQSKSGRHEACRTDVCSDHVDCST